MSRKKKSNKQRRERRERLRVRRQERFDNAPQAPARPFFLGKSRKGDEAEVCFDFRDQPEIEVDFEDAEDPGEAIKEASLRNQWSELDHTTKGEA